MSENTSIDYKNYRDMRNTVWKVLSECDINCLPVDVFAIAKHYNIHVMAYNTEIASEIISICNLSKFRQNKAFSVFTNKYYIFYDESIPKNEVRFYIAHELCHILLRHKMNSIEVGYFTAYYTNWNRDSSTNAVDEKEANRFASRLLAPACVLGTLKVESAEKIAALCGMPLVEASIRAKRLKELNARNAFLTSELEKKVIEQFMPYIYENS